VVPSTSISALCCPLREPRKRLKPTLASRSATKVEQVFSDFLRFVVALALDLPGKPPYVQPCYIGKHRYCVVANPQERNEDDPIKYLYECRFVPRTRQPAKRKTLARALSLETNVIRHSFVSQIR
jgi:hypothetical protein